jgi:hypothetical protein
VLVVVVLTVVMFGGTTVRTLEVLGIRTDEDDATSSSDDEGPLSIRGGGGRLQRLADDPHHLKQNQRYVCPSSARTGTYLV